MSRIPWQKMWMEIAEAFYLPRSRRTMRQQSMTGFGLCWPMIKYGLSDHKIARIMNKLNPETNALYDHWLPIWTRKCDIIRAQFAESMAGFTDEEFEQLIEDLTTRRRKKNGRSK